MVTTLEDAEAAQCGDRIVFLSGIRAYVVNYGALHAYPRKFTYRGCGRMLPGKWICSKSMENGMCDHDPSTEEISDFFRFDVYVTDGTLGGQPLKATIFGAAQNLLGLPAPRFKCFTELEQDEHVAEVIHGGMPLCEISIRAGNGNVIIHTLQVLPNGNGAKSGTARRRNSDTGEATSTITSSRTVKGGGSTSAGQKSGPVPTAQTPKGEEMTVTLRRAVKLISEKFLELASHGSDSE